MRVGPQKAGFVDQHLNVSVFFLSSKATQLLRRSILYEGFVGVDLFHDYSS